MEVFNHESYCIYFIMLEIVEEPVLWSVWTVAAPPVCVHCAFGRIWTKVEDLL